MEKVFVVVRTKCLVTDDQLEIHKYTTQKSEIAFRDLEMAREYVCAKYEVETWDEVTMAEYHKVFDKRDRSSDDYCCIWEIQETVVI